MSLPSLDHLGRPFKPKNIARILLMPGHFLIEGPLELAIATETAAHSITNPDEAKSAIMNVWAGWYVQCSVSGEWIALCDLRYWMNEEVYARPELVPALGWYVPLPSA